MSTTSTANIVQPLTKVINGKSTPAKILFPSFLKNNMRYRKTVFYSILLVFFTFLGVRFTFLFPLKIIWQTLYDDTTGQNIDKSGYLIENLEYKMLGIFCLATAIIILNKLLQKSNWPIFAFGCNQQGYPLTRFRLRTILPSVYLFWFFCSWLLLQPIFILLQALHIIQLRYIQTAAMRT